MMNAINLCCTSCDINHVVVDVEGSLVKLHAQTTSDRVLFVCATGDEGERN